MGKRRTSYKMIAVLLGLWLACVGAIPMKVQCMGTCSDERKRGPIKVGPVSATLGVPQHDCCSKGKAPAERANGDCAPNSFDFMSSAIDVTASLHSALFDALCPLPSPLDGSQSGPTCCDISKGSRPDVSGVGLREVIINCETVSLSALSCLAIEGPLFPKEGNRPNHLANSTSIPADRPLYLRNLSLLI